MSPKFSIGFLAHIIPVQNQYIKATKKIAREKNSGSHFEQFYENIPKK